MYKLIALDLDDTLLGRHDGLLSPVDRAALAAARARGVDVTFVTGRTWTATAGFVADLAITAPVICFTGAMICEPTGEVLHESTVAFDDARRICERGDAEGWSYRLYFRGGRVVQSRPAEDYVPKIGAIFDPVNGCSGALMPALVREGAPFQIVAIGHRSVEPAVNLASSMPALAAVTYDRFTETSRTHLMRAGVSKGAALEAYCRRQGIEREAVLAMGDGEADRSMIEWAGTGVAMGWAPEGVRRSADLVADSEDPNPVATMLTRLLGV